LHLADETLAIGKIEGFEAKLTRHRIVHHQAGEFVADEAPQRLGDGLVQLAQVQACDHRIDDGKHHSQPVAVAGELLP
jgi:hypothetical protein